MGCPFPKRQMPNTSRVARVPRRLCFASVAVDVADAGPERAPCRAELIGATPEEAVRALCVARGRGDVAAVVLLEGDQRLDPAQRRLETEDREPARLAAGRRRGANPSEARECVDQLRVQPSPSGDRPDL